MGHTCPTCNQQGWLSTTSPDGVSTYRCPKGHEWGPDVALDISLSEAPQKAARLVTRVRTGTGVDLHKSALEALGVRPGDVVECVYRNLGQCPDASTGELRIEGVKGEPMAAPICPLDKVPNELYCSSCQKKKFVTEFRKDTTSSRGYRHRCKACDFEAKRERKPPHTP